MQEAPKNRTEVENEPIERSQCNTSGKSTSCCCCKTRSLALLSVLLLVLAVLVLWQKDTWFALFSGKSKVFSTALDDVRDQGVILTQDVQKGFHPQVVIPRTFPAITKIPTTTAEKNEAAIKRGARAAIRDNELVLGVMVGKESRAYPINMLTGPQREILNDKLGGKAIAATW